ncbi:MAG: FtsX-like permease family protein [Gemmataceae bacterium]|nr:FtsX-like permease family protein [Gemmataceae bacterium]
MFVIALRMLLHKRSRFALTAVGIGVAFFLTAAQTGLLIGWCNTTSALIRHANVDVWVMAPRNPAFDYGTAIPRQRLYQARSVAGVAWAEGMILTFGYWQRPDGRRVNVELVGLDDSSVGGPWDMRVGRRDSVHAPHTVLVDELYRDLLDVGAVGAETELFGRRAVVGGLSRGVRSFTTSPFVFTSLKSVVRYDPRYRDDELTYVLVRCAPGHSPETVRDALAREVPHVEALTTREFAVRTMRYWMLGTGAGITVVLTAVLGLIVAAVLISQTLFAITQDHLANYATLLALGFSRGQLVAGVLGQSLVLGVVGLLLGGALFGCVARVSAATAIPVEMTGPALAGLLAICLGCCLLASFVSVRSIFRVDPVLVFRS